MASYVDGFIIPVPRDNLAVYRRLAERPARSGWSMAHSPTWSAWPMT
jgi:uncharacterized protein YbaA (DUF1428 family)